MMEWKTGKNGNKFLIDTDKPRIYKDGYTNYPTCKLSKNEYGMVYHEMNKWFHNRYVGKTITLSSIRNHTYMVEIYDYNEYRIVKKAKIKSRL